VLRGGGTKEKKRNMEKQVKEKYNDDILQAARQRYGITDDQIRLLDGFESFIYEFEQDNQAYILRIGHSHRRSAFLIQGEVDWINYLAGGGASVAQAVLSKNGKLVELIDDQNSGYFLATAFTRASGQHPGKEAWNEALFERYGRLIGKMHALTKNYEPSDPTWKRPEWNDPEMLEVESWLPASESIAVEKFLEVKAHLDTLPKDKETYGLIHQDAHGGNFFVDEVGNITLFDFDDCAYSWLINDIAIVLFYAVMWEKDVPAFTQKFMSHFLRGYRRENQLDAAWLKEIPYFLKLREIDLYAIIHRSFDVNHLEDPWNINFMHNRKHKIENDVPYIDFDFESLAVYT
jgi:Ser/Thr protein kinase RdoA (MazF antagonist)